MTFKSKFKRFQKFITHDLWFVEIEESVSGFKKFLLKELQMMVLVVKATQKHFLFSRASALAFTTLLFFKAFGGEMVETKIKPLIYEYLTAGQGENITEYIDSFLSSATVDTLGSIGFIFLLVAVYSILSSIETSFNAIWQINKNRSPVEMLKTYLTIIFITPILLIVSIWLTTRMQFIMNIGDSFWGGFSTFMLYYFTPFILVFLLFFALLVIIPNTEVKFSNAFVGAFVGALAFTIFKELFIHYTKLAVSYNKIYGSIAVLPFFMLWIYFSWIVVLLSVEVTYVRQNVHNLKHLEQNMLTNRVDKIRIAFMIIIRIIKNFISGKEQSSQLEISEELDIPIRDIADTLSKLESGGVIVEIARKPDSYTLNMPLKKLTVGKITDCVDKMFIPNKNYRSEQDFQELSRIISENQVAANRDELVSALIEE
jgi:membrane protein